MSICSLCTIACNNDWESLKSLLQSICIYNPFIPIFIGTTQEIMNKIFESELSDGRIQIKLKEQYVEQPNIDKIKDIIGIALERYENTCYIDVNSFFCSDIRNIHIESSSECSNISSNYETDQIAISFQRNSDKMYIIEKNKYCVDVNNATYDTNIDISKIIIFKSLSKSNESKFHNNYVNALFREYVFKYYK